MISTAQTELLALAAAMRGEEWASDLAAALIAARNGGWDWPKAFLYAARLMADEDAHPRDLTAATRDPLSKRQGEPSDSPAVAPTIAWAKARAEEAAEAGRARKRAGAA
jgi:hypothetical protein